MKTKLVLVMKIEVHVGEDDRMYGAQITHSKADDPSKVSTQQFENIALAFDDILNDLLGMKLKQITEQQEIHSCAGNA